MLRRIEQEIVRKLSEALRPSHLLVLNESHKHNVPKNSETHFKVVVVSEQFEGKAPIIRHRLINQILAEEFQAGVHALSIHARTPTQWEADSAVESSPNCMGGENKSK